MQPNPDLLDELYNKKRKAYPNELPFPERFDLKLTKDAFQKGIIRVKTNEVQRIVDWKGNLIREEPITTIGYKKDSRLDCALKASLPKSFDPISFVYSELYDNIQLGLHNDEIDLEYNFFFNTLDPYVKAILVGYDTIQTFNSQPERYQKETLRVRIQYAERIVNSAGPRWDCYGYIYVPERRKQ